MVLKNVFLQLDMADEGRGAMDHEAQTASALPRPTSAALWERSRKVEGLKSIRVFGKTSSCVFAHLKPTGSWRPSRSKCRMPVRL